MHYMRLGICTYFPPPLKVPLLPLLLLSLLGDHAPVTGRERIIGGTIVEGENRPAFLTVFNFQPSTSVKCSSSIISKFFIVSAAHCIVSKKHIMDGSCLKNYKKAKFETVCERQPNGDMKLTFPVQSEPSPEVYVNVDNLSNDAADSTKKVLVDYIISHKDGYKGGKYGKYGGYDIILIKLRTPLYDLVKACLPGPGYQYNKPYIGGYGRYRRVPCEVNDMGPSVFQYCKVDSKECSPDSRAFKQSKCNVKFQYENQEYKGCLKNSDTPSASNLECVKFRAATGFTDRKFLEYKLNEIVIVSDDNTIITKCYRTNAGKYGWCGITKKIISEKRDISKYKDLSVTADEGWGVCSDTCEDNENSFITGKARVKPVEIIDQAYCDEELNKPRAGRKMYEVPPLVYCVAYNETFHTQFFHKISDTSYVKLKDQIELQETLLNRKNPWYIRATGSCKGDSGGPLYEKKERGYVLLGSTSRGTGTIANCGGIDNPTHYVRMQDMLPWIQTYVPEEELCIVS